MSTLSEPATQTSASSSTESLARRDEEDASKSTLEKLLDYLLASKRSLSSTNHVWRANEIVNSAREAVAEGVVLRARSEFLRQAVDEQLNLLARVKNGVEHTRRRGQTDFEATLRDLDEADARLQATLDLLKSTLVEPSLRQASEEQRTLHHFVDEGGVEKLKTGLRQAIDQTQEAHHELRETVKEFNADINLIKVSLESKTSMYVEHGGSDAPISTILPSLESQAKEMADLLESLVRHFDLCVNALKHTEGGGAAAQNITTDMPVGISVDQDNQNDSIESISDEEKREMLDVLAKDAAELEDVVMEIRDRLGEMEMQFENLNAYIQHLASTNADTTAAFHQLEDVGSRLPRYVLNGRDFLRKWEEQRQQILERMEDIESLRKFYDHFVTAYDGLIVEIGRRKDMQNRMEAIVKGAMTKVDLLYQGMPVFS